MTAPRGTLNRARWLTDTQWDGKESGLECVPQTVGMDARCSAKCP